MFAQNFSNIVIPRAAELRLALATAARECSVHGDFADERTTVAYCVAYAWDHYASFASALACVGVKPEQLGIRPLVVDIGCGPGTAIAALGEWLYCARQRLTDVRYVGIDRSWQMLRLARCFATDRSLFEAYEPLLLRDAAEMTGELETQMQDRDRIVITMSYVLHQQFMSDGSIFRAVIRDLCAYRRPILILAQDANKPEEPEPNIRVWPDARLRGMLNDVETHGYTSSIWSKTFASPRYVLDEHGNATMRPPDQRTRSVAIVARLFPT